MKKRISKNWRGDLKDLEESHNTHERRPILQYIYILYYFLYSFSFFKQFSLGIHYYSTTSWVQQLNIKTRKGEEYHKVDT